MTFHPRALIASVVGLSALWYAIDHQVGIVAIVVEVYMTLGFWALTERRGGLRPER